MKEKLAMLLTASVLLALLLQGCTKDNDKNDNEGGEMDKIAIVTNINTGSTPVAYLGTREDLSAGAYNNSNAQQVVSYALAQTYKGAVYLIEARSGDKIIKYTRNADGSLTNSGSITMPGAAYPYCIAFESDTKAYLSLGNTGKIIIFDPSSMTQSGTIDLASYALRDGSPDPGIILYRNRKLYVGCLQTSDGVTSAHPAQLLIIDLNNNNQITSVTDNRSTYASNPSSAGSMFFDEQGDLYVLCMGSWGFMPAQKCGFLRIRNGQNTFDASYFFNVRDYSVDGIPGSHLDYVHRMEYAGSGIVYATGNVPSLMSNPPDYVLDKTFGAFKVDVRNQKITKIDIPYSNGYAACVMNYKGKAYYGMSTNTGVGIYSYDPAADKASAQPVISTQGDPSVICSFE